MQIIYKTYRRAKAVATAPNTNTQYVYRRDNDGETTTAVSGGNTNDTYVPSGWSASGASALNSSNPYAWRATRTRPDASSDWSDFGDFERWEEEFYIPNGVGVVSTHGNYVPLKTFTTAISTPTGWLDVSSLVTHVRAYGDDFAAPVFLRAQGLIS